MSRHALPEYFADIGDGTRYIIEYSAGTYQLCMRKYCRKRGYYKDVQRSKISAPSDTHHHVSDVKAGDKCCMICTGDDDVRYYVVFEFDGNHRFFIEVSKQPFEWKPLIHSTSGRVSVYVVPETD